MPKKKSESKKISSTKSVDSNITDTSESNKSHVTLSDNSDKSKKTKKKTTKKPTKKPTKKKKKLKKDDYVIIKADPVELKKSLNYNIPVNKKEDLLSKDEYDIKFNNLRTKYISLCKEFSDIQINLKNKDNEREDILKQIRELQKKNSLLIKEDLNLDETNKKKVKKKVKNDKVNLIDRYKKKCNKNIILKPLRDTDMETDDSESEELSDSDSSESDN
jgi:hypothetical protein